MLYSSVQLALLIHSAGISSRTSFCIIIEASLNLLASVGLIWLSTWAHKRTVRPSSLITAYLLVNFCCAFQRVPKSDHFLNELLALALPCSAFILLNLEIQNKALILLEDYANEPPEVTTSFFGNVLFWWINPILAQGYSRSLGEDDIPLLDKSTSSKALREAVIRSWDQRGVCSDSSIQRSVCQPTGSKA